MATNSTLFNIPANTLVPGPRLVIIQQGDGKCTATMDFTCRKFDLSSNIIQAKLAKGTSLTSLYPEAGSFWSFLYLESYTSSDEPGGITTVSCQFAGVNDSEDSGFTSDDSIIYTRNNALREESIFNHPDLIALASDTQIDAIRAVLKGEGYLSGTEVLRNLNDEVIGDIADPSDCTGWYDLIVRKGWETYPIPTSEWTKTATGRGVLSITELGKMGKIDDPPGNPYAPTDQTWVMTGATESIQVLGEGQNSYSITWTSGNWPSLIYPSA